MSSPHDGAVVSTDHADESLSMHDSVVASLASTIRTGATTIRPRPRIISPAELDEHNNNTTITTSSYWCVVDGFVVDATDFLHRHPGGLDKLLSANAAATGATGRPFGFSFSRGRNAHFPDTGKTFKEGVERYLRGEGDYGVAAAVAATKAGGAAAEEESEFLLPPADVVFKMYGKIVILGLLPPSG
jgi:hypothetical protein